MFNLYDYNTRSEVVDAVRYFHPYSVENVGGQVGSSTNSTENPVGLQDWSYAYDPAKRGTGNIPLRPVERDYAGQVGNRTGTTKANAAADYTANALNQYTERTVPDSSDIIGSAETNVTVTVNTNTATRQDYYWYHRLEVDNLYTAAYPQVVVEAVFDPGTNDPYIVSSETGNVFVAESPETFTYDDDGNLLTDGRFEYAWDCENRLISATTTTNLPAETPIVHVAFDYDYMSRRVGKTVHLWDDGVTNWVEQSSASFLYDGWNLVQEVRDEDSEVSTNQFVWGLDLSGSLQGAGGIGGLLSVVKGTNAYFIAYDGNGNVSEYVDASGDIAAHYEYSPFGETIVATGELALENKFRFSTKYFCDEFGMGDWGRRWYSPSMARFVSEDPIGEKGGLNLYCFVRNDAIVNVDVFGEEVLSTRGADLDEIIPIRLVRDIGIETPACGSDSGAYVGRLEVYAGVDGSINKRISSISGSRDFFGVYIKLHFIIEDKKELACYCGTSESDPNPVGWIQYVDGRYDNRYEHPATHEIITYAPPWYQGYAHNPMEDLPGYWPPNIPAISKVFRSELRCTKKISDSMSDQNAASFRFITDFIWAFETEGKFPHDFQRRYMKFKISYD